MIDVAVPIRIPIRKTTRRPSKRISLDENLFIDIVELASFQEQPTTSQKSDDLETLLSNYEDLATSPTFSNHCSPHLTSQCSTDQQQQLQNFVSNRSVPFPAYKWELTMPENIVVMKPERGGNRESTSSKFPSPLLSKSSAAHSLSNNPWSESSSLSSFTRNGSYSLGSPQRTASDIRYASILEETKSQSIDAEDCNEILATSHELISDARFPPQPKSIDIAFTYKAINGTSVRLKIRDRTTETNPNSIHRRIKTYAVQDWAHLRDEIMLELSSLLGENLDLDVDSKAAAKLKRHDRAKFPKRLSSSLRNTRRLRSYTTIYTRENFGRPLNSIRSQSIMSSPFPLFVHQIVELLLHEAENNQVEGLFRTASVKTRLDACYKICNVLGTNDGLPEELADGHNVYILADLLKRFLRELPESLLSQRIWQLMMRSMKLDGLDRLIAFQCCTLLLNPSQRDALFILGALLLELSRFEHNTLMSMKSLVTVILPNICEIGSINPLEEAKRCKNLLPVLTYYFEHIYDVMCIPTKLLHKIDARGEDAERFQIFTNNDVLERDFGMELDQSYWTSEHPPDLPNIAVKSKRDYIESKFPSEYRAETSVHASSSDVFAFLVENRSWDPTFADYKISDSSCTEGMEIVECKTRFCSTDAPTLFLKRNSGRVYHPDSQAKIYFLFEKSIQQANSNVTLNKLAYFLQTVDAYNTRVVFLSSLDVRNSNKNAVYGSKEAGQVLERLQSHFHRDNANQIP